MVFLLLLDQIVLQKHILPRHSILLLKLKHSTQQILYPLVSIWVNWEAQRRFFDNFYQLLLVVSVPRSFPIEHLIKYYSY